MTAEFDWWLLILGLVIGAGLVWLILAELPRREADLGSAELEVEAAWIAAQLAEQDARWDAAMVAAVLREHRGYLKLPPPDDAPVAPGADAAPRVAASPAPSTAGLGAPETPAAPADSDAPKGSERSDEPSSGDRASAGPG